MMVVYQTPKVPVVPSMYRQEQRYIERYVPHLGSVNTLRTQ